MAFKITDKCDMCGLCEPECPVDAISKGVPKYIIDPAKCESYGLCVLVCPIPGAIVPSHSTLGEIYYCPHCNAEVQITKAGWGTFAPLCCEGQSMRLRESAGQGEEAN